MIYKKGKEVNYSFKITGNEHEKIVKTFMKNEKEENKVAKELILELVQFDDNEVVSDVEVWDFETDEYGEQYSVVLVDTYFK